MKTQREKISDYIHVLRTTDAEQCNAVLENEDGKFCAIGIGLKELGLPNQRNNYDAIEDVLGLNQKLMWEVIRLNDDDQLSFKEIAERIETEILPKFNET